MSPSEAAVPRIGLRVAVVAKQVPRGEDLELGADRRVRRSGVALELNPHCRRAVAQGVELAAGGDGSCVVYTLGPPEAEAVVREAVAWGADAGVHLCDTAFAGSDSLATAHALATALRADGPWDLVLCGRSSADAETGQVGPQLAELLDLPFAGAAAELRVSGGEAWARCELGDSWRTVRVDLPAVVSCAERLIAPCKATPLARARVSSERLRRVTATALGTGPWGEAASPTRVGTTRSVSVERLGLRLAGPVDEQVARAVVVLAARGLVAGPGHDADTPPPLPAARDDAGAGSSVGAVVVALEPGRDRLARQLLGAAASLAREVDGSVVAAGPELPDAADLASWGADRAVLVVGTSVEEDVAEVLASWCAAEAPWAVLGSSTGWGREVLARLAVRRRAGLTGDAVELGADDGRLVCWKPAFSGRLLAAVTSSSDLQLATVRPGTLTTPRPRPAGRAIPVAIARGRSRGRVRVSDHGEDPRARALWDARAVVCVGQGVPPDAYRELDDLLAVLGAELGATRKVTDRGWLPRSRQVGITGWSLAPALYVGVGTSGRFNHLAGVARAGTIVVVNHDPAAPGFEAADVGIVADWRVAVPALVAALSRAAGPTGGEGPSGPSPSGPSPSGPSQDGHPGELATPGPRALRGPRSSSPSS